MTVKLNPTFRDVYENPKKFARKYGQLCKRIVAIIKNLQDATVKTHILIPGNPHPLTYICRNMYSVTVCHPFRLIYIVDNAESITICDVCQYHDHHSCYSRIKK